MTVPVVQSCAFSGAGTVAAPAGITPTDWVVVTSFVVTFLAADVASCAGMTKRIQLDIDSGVGYWVHWCVFDSNGTNQSGAVDYTVTTTGTLLGSPTSARRISGTSGWNSAASTVGYVNKQTIGTAAADALPALTTTVNDCIALLGIVVGTGFTITTPADWTLDGGFDDDGFYWNKGIPNAGSTGTATTTTSGTTDRYYFLYAYMPGPPAKVRRRRTYQLHGR